MKTVMILGASYTQMPLFRAAKRMGLRTAAVSIPGNYPGFDEADIKITADLSDRSAVLKAAAELAPDAVVSCGLDLIMRSIGAVCEQQGIPGPSDQAALRASNKFFMKKAFLEHDVRTAKFYKVESLEQLHKAAEAMTFPIMVKAVDQNGSKGVIRCNDLQEADDAYVEAMNVTNCPYVIAEEFIEGSLFGVEGMIQNGEPVFLLPNESEVFHGRTGIPIGHTVPYPDPDLIPEISHEVIKAAKALGLDNCPINCDLIMRDQLPYVVEMTGRAGANGLPEVTGTHFGVDYYEMIIRLALGEIMQPYFEVLNRPAVISHIFKSTASGTLIEIECSGYDEEGIVDLSFNIEQGDQIREYHDCADRIGQIIVKDQTAGQCREKIQRISRSYSLLMEGGPNAGLNRYPVL